MIYMSGTFILRHVLFMPYARVGTHYNVLYVQLTLIIVIQCYFNNDK